MQSPPDEPVGDRDLSTILAADVLPSWVGEYRVDRELGRGGMGVVYLAHDPKLDRPVAVKVLAVEDRSEQRLQLFAREARAAARLSHANIATVYEFGQADDAWFIAMEYVEGCTLHGALLSGGGMPLPKALDLACQIAEGLAAAHSRGIVHRDLKPQNIMLTAEDRVKILDFGLAKFLAGEQCASDRTTQLTVTGSVAGTPAYMSPEQAVGDMIDVRSDVFSFGVLLYEMVTGRLPFRGETNAGLLRAILSDAHAPARNMRPEIPGELDELIARCLEKERAARFQSAQELIGALSRVKRLVESGGRHEIASIAVLPFANLSPDPDNEYFADGMAEEILNALSQIEALRVASRTSSFAFKGRHEDICKIGQQLRVGAVLEGSVRKEGKRLRITIQLVDVKDGFQLWSARYDRELEDVFVIQDQIARSTAETLRVVITEGAERAIGRLPTSNFVAYEFYLRGRQYFHESGRRGLEFARLMFRRAIEIDPHYALAYAGVAECCSLMYVLVNADAELLREADEASQRALELAPDLAKAHSARGTVISLAGEFDEAVVEFDAAIRLDPQLPDVYAAYGRMCLIKGELDRAADLLGKACELDRADYYARSLLGVVYAGLGCTADANSAHRQVLELVRQHLLLNPDHTRAVASGAVAWAHLGERALALTWARRAAGLVADDSEVLYLYACIHAILREVPTALDWLERAVAAGCVYRGWAENDPDLMSVRDDPRFKSLLEKI